MPPSLSELKVTPSFCFAFKIPDDVTASSIYCSYDPLSAMNENLKSNEILCIKVHKSATLVGMATFMHYACMQSATHLIQSLILVIQVSKFQDEFIKSSFLPKYDQKIVNISAL